MRSPRSAMPDISPCLFANSSQARARELPMTEIDMGPSVAVARHQEAPLSKDGFSMVSIESTAAVTSKSLLNYGEKYCGCLTNVACSDDSFTAVSGLPGTSRKFKKYGSHIDQRVLHSVSAHPDGSFEDGSGAESVAQCHPKLVGIEHDTSIQGGNCKSVSQEEGYTISHDDNASLYPNGRRKRVKAADLEEPPSTDSGPQSAIGPAMPSLELCEIADPTPCEKFHPTEKTPWRNEARQPEVRRRKWAQADPLLDLWKAVSASKYAAAFRRPVALLEEYDGVVRQRMDLSTIRRRLENGLSCTMIELHRDLMLMLANAVVYNKHGSEMFQMALKLKDHITKLFKEVSTTKQNACLPTVDNIFKSGSKASKPKQQLPLPQDEFYSSGRSKDCASYSSKQNSEFQKTLGDLPMAPCKRQRTARKPRLCTSLDALGFQLQDCAAVEIDSSSEEEVAAMLICIRSGQGFSDRDNHATGRNLFSDKGSLLLERQSKGLDCISYPKYVTTNQFEQAAEVDNGAKSSEFSAAIHPTLPWLGEGRMSELIAIERKDKVTGAETPGLEGSSTVPLLCSYPDMRTRNGHCQQRLFSSYKPASGNSTHKSQLAIKEGPCKQSSWCMSGANVAHSVGMEGQLRDVEAPLSVDGPQPSHTRSSTSHSLCSDVGNLGSVQDERGLDMKNEYCSPAVDIRSEKNCMGLKHKWQQRWQMQSAATSEETASVCLANVAAKSVTNSISHCDLPCHQSAFDAERDAISLAPF